MAGSASLQIELVKSAELVAVSGSGPVFQDERFCRKLAAQTRSICKLTEVAKAVSFMAQLLVKRTISGYCSVNEDNDLHWL